MTSALPAKAPLRLYRGDTRVWEDTFTYADGSAIDLTGHTFLAQIRENADAAEVMAEITVAVTDAEAGTVRRTLTATEAAKLVVGTAYWDLQATDPDGAVRTYLAGPVTIVGDVSRGG